MHGWISMFLTLMKTIAFTLLVPILLGVLLLQLLRYVISITAVSRNIEHTCTIVLVSPFLGGANSQLGTLVITS